MKSSDEQIDEELRKALRERFDNFEKLPHPALREKIFKGLGGGTSLVQTGLVASLVLLIALTGAVYFVSSAVEKKHNVIPKMAAQEFSEELDVKFNPQMAQIFGPQPDMFVAEHEKGAGRTDLSAKTSVTSEPDPETDKTVRKHAPRATRAAAKQYRFKRADVVKWIEMMRSNPSFGSLWIDERYISPADKDFLESEMQKMMPDRAQPDSVASSAGDIKAMEGPLLADQDIGVLDHRPLALPKCNWQPDTLVSPGEPRKRYEYLFKEHWGFIVNLTPLRTFQILTVRPGNGVVYQNFILPGKISAATVGYKFSAGAERKGFQLLLNYGQFKQSYRYEIATSEFAVGPDLSGNYEVVRKGIPQEENSTVRLIGMSVKRHMVRRTHFLRNYYGDVGAEYSRDLSSKKNVVWLNAGFGKELFAANHVVMTVGPYFEYSPSKLRNPDNPFKIQPYQIGLSVGLRYIKK